MAQDIDTERLMIGRERAGSDHDLMGQADIAQFCLILYDISSIGSQTTQETRIFALEGLGRR